MALPIPTTVHDPRVQQALDAISSAFPLKAGSIGKEAIGDAQIAKASITDERLVKPVIAGAVEGTGTKAFGSGFTSEKTATGNYKITLSTELSTTGIFVVTSVAANLIPGTGALSKKIFTVAFINSASVAVDTAFSFLIKAS